MMFRKSGTTFLAGIMIGVFFVACCCFNVLAGIKVLANGSQSYSVKLQMYNANTDDSSNTLYPRFKLYNTGTNDVNLSDVKILYYYTIDGEEEQSFWCDWSSRGSSKVRGTFVEMTQPVNDADYCLETWFKNDAGSLAPGESVELHLRAAKDDWSNYTQSNDYSFNSSSSDYADWDKSPVYIGENLVWGQDISSPPTPEPTEEPTPVPEATPTPGPTVSPSPTPTQGPAETSLSIQMYNKHRKDNDNTLSPWFMLYNAGTSPVNLDDVKIRYYYTINGEKAQNFWCDWSSAGTGNITGTLVKMPDAMIGADYYLEIGFKPGAGSIQPGQSVEIHTRIAKTDWTDYTQTDDFSYNANDNGYTDWEKAPVYMDGNLLFGTEPDVIAPTPVPNLSVELRMCNTKIQDRTNTIFARYILDNTGNTPIELQDVKIRYYYSIDGEKAQNFWCDWSSAGKNNITGRYVRMDESLDMMDYFAEVGFTSGAGILEPGDNVEIHTRMTKTDWTDYYQSNDYSFSGSRNDYIPWNKVSVIINGDMVWGDNNLLASTTITDIIASETSLTISWLPVDGATGYEIQDNGVIAGTSSGTSFELTGLQAGTLHSCGVRPVSSSLEGIWSDIYEKWTLPGITDGITSEADENNITVFWQDVTGAAGYDVEVDNVFIEDVQSPYYHTGLEAGTDHRYRVRAKNESGIGVWSSPVHIWTVPPAVEGINAYATQTQVIVSWEDAPGAEYYDVLIDGVLVEDQLFVYAHGDLFPGTEHCFRVRAKNESGAGVWSEEYIKWTLPGIVENVRYQATEYNIQIEWDDVTGAAGYDLEVDGELLEDASAPYMHENLLPGTRHVYRLRAKNESGTGWWNEALEVWTIPDVVNAVSASAFENEIIIQWEPVTGAESYDIELDGTVTEQILCPFVHEGLPSGTGHTYRVRARNGSGTGVWSSSISKKTLPGVIDSLFADSEETSIILTWDEVTGADAYDLEIDGVVIENADSGYLHDGLIPGTSHEYRVRAKNISGEGVWSETLTAWTIPDVVQNIALSYGSESIMVTWDEVTGADTYDIEIDGVVTENISNPYICGGLLSGTFHIFRVRAENSGGEGRWSNEYSGWTLPGIVENMEFEATQTSLEVIWSEVTGADAYDLEIDGSIISDAVSPYIFTELDPGTEHLFRIRAKNSSGQGSWSDLINKWTIPDIVQSIMADATDGSITVSWDSVTGAAGYDIEIYGTPVDTYGITSYTHVGLNPNTQITYRVRAKNSSGEGEWSPFIAKTTLPGVPSQINSLQGEASIMLSWAEVSGASGYNIEIDGEIAGEALNSLYLHEGLLPNTVHTYRVRAYNNEGTGNWSNMVTASTLLTAPVNLHIQSFNPEIIIAWDVVGDAAGYDIEADGEVIDNGSATTFRHLGLIPDTEHIYRVRAKTESNNGIWSSPLKLITPLAPPEEIAVLSTSDEINIRWNMVPGASGYEIEADGEVIDNGLSTVYMHEGLEPYTEHLYRIRIWNRGGAGEWSGYFNASTLVGKPQDISFAPSSEEIEIYWDEVPGAQGYDIIIDGVLADAGSETAYTHTGLEPNSLHMYKVRAKRNEVLGEWSETFTAKTLPGIPANISVLPKSNEIQMTWDEVEGTASYEIEIDDSLIVETDENLYTVKELESNTPYAFRIRSKNESGESDWSEYINAVTSPGIPGNLTAQATITEIVLVWDEVDGAVYYDMEIDGIVIRDIEETMYRHEGLKSNSRHIYRVRSKGSESVSEWSDALIYNTVPEISIPVNKDIIFNFVIVAPPKEGVMERTIIVTYNADELDVFDLYAATPEPETEIGEIDGTGIEVTGYTSGRIEYRISGADKTSVCIIKFLSKKSGHSNVTYAIY